MKGERPDQVCVLHKLSCTVGDNWRGEKLDTQNPVEREAKFID